MRLELKHGDMAESAWREQIDLDLISDRLGSTIFFKIDWQR